MRRRLRAGLLLASLAAAAVAPAGTVYRWTDRDGVVHYGDHAPRDKRLRVTTLRTPDAPSSVARLRLERVDQRVHAWADNRLQGPIEVMLRSAVSPAPIADPALPARATVPAGGSALVAVIEPPAGRRVQVLLDTVPGRPAAQPRDVVYRFPLQQARVRLEQGFHGAFSHADAENRHALDFAADVGTPVLAARDGTVMQVESGFDTAGLDARDVARANFIRIVHDDGSMALYAHLDADGVQVAPGARVRAGQVIGRSGNTGYSTGPHLHFVVQANRGMRLESIPVRVLGPQGLVTTGP